MENDEIFESLELAHEKKSAITNPYEHRFERQLRLVYYEFLFIEILSIAPPTDCVFTLNFTTHKDNRVKKITFYSLEYRKDFIFENGFYILYLDSVKPFSEGFPKDLVPLDFKYTNKRDINSSAKLFYKVTTNDQIRPVANPD
jgi:hypothetical protein